jgi:hypothetical protein
MSGEFDLHQAHGAAEIPTVEKGYADPHLGDISNLWSFRRRPESPVNYQPDPGLRRDDGLKTF